MYMVSADAALTYWLKVKPINYKAARDGRRNWHAVRVDRRRDLRTLYGIVNGHCLAVKQR